MRTIDANAKAQAIRTLDNAEIGSVAGGALPTIYNPVGMPDRMVGGCGTMWILDRLLKSFGTPR